MSLAWLSTPEDITPGSASTWTDEDRSSDPLVTSRTKGAMIEFINAGSGANAVGCQMKGSTDNLLADVIAMNTNMRNFQYVGMDANGIFQTNVESTTDVTVYLWGYFNDNCHFFSNKPDKSTGTTAAWTDVDISGDTIGGDVALGAIVGFYATATETGGVRKKGSTDDTNHDWYPANNAGGLIGCDSNEIFQQKIAATTVDLYLTGYVTSNAFFHTNAQNKTPGSTGSFQTATSDGDSIATILQVLGSGSPVVFDVRPIGSSNDSYRESGYNSPVVPCNQANQFEVKMSSITSPYFIVEVGYFTGAESWFPQGVRRTTNRIIRN